MRSAGSPPHAALGQPSTERARLNLWILAIVVIGIVVVGILFSLIYYSTAQSATKTFSYNAKPSQSSSTYSSISVSDTDGLISIVPWTKTVVAINGTITARGLGSSVSAVSFSNSSINGNVIFQALFPTSTGFFLSQSYSVGINVFVPATIRLASVQVTNVNGGVRVNNLNASSVSLTTVNGLVSLSCLYCGNATLTSTNGSISASMSSLVSNGTYSLSATNANLALTLPSASSFRLQATAVNGGIIVSGFNGLASGQTHLAGTFGTGSAVVTLTSVNGQISITGT